jgi:hypothetical protein
MPHIPPPAQAARNTSLLRDHPRWSIFWDKRYGLWRAAEDDPDSTCTPKQETPTPSSST